MKNYFLFFSKINMMFLSFNIKVLIIIYITFVLNKNFVSSTFSYHNYNMIFQ